MTRRRLSDDERVLWRGVTRSVVPLRTPREEADEPASSPRPAAKSRPKTGFKTELKAAAPSASVAPVSAAKPEPPPLAPLERKLRQRIARGSHPIDGRLDLHGMTQAEAYGVLLHYLRGLQARGGRVVLVITGKGARGEASERGVLKRMVPHWLRLPELRGVVIGFESASARHGGEGALYVRLRRSRAD
ncbi:MAG TPA: Smr/MutS family protein [Xanthobacteraceae bacterium]|jgi:DNA-nicking Smr family endonuclease|nr:Smr/MutS family protein [Xanthobacteraceae bacterium]